MFTMSVITHTTFIIDVAHRTQNPWIIVTDWGDYWEVQYDGIDTPHDLVEGTYTVTIKYEIEV